MHINAMETLVFAILVVFLIWGAQQRIRYHGTNPFGDVGLTYSRFWGIWRNAKIYRWNDELDAWMDVKTGQVADHNLELFIQSCVENDPLAKPPMDDDTMRRFIENRQKQYAERGEKRQKKQGSNFSQSRWGKAAISEKIKVVWLSFTLVLLGYTLCLWLAVMNGFDPTGLDKPLMLHNPAIHIGLQILWILLVTVGVVVAFLQGSWYGIGSLAFLAVLWLVGTEVGHLWIRSIRRDANRRAGIQIFPDD